MWLAVLQVCCGNYIKQPEAVGLDRPVALPSFTDIDVKAIGPFCWKVDRPQVHGRGSKIPLAIERNDLSRCVQRVLVWHYDFRQDFQIFQRRPSGDEQHNEQLMLGWKCIVNLSYNNPA